jgi:hypothetical protein
MRGPPLDHRVGGATVVPQDLSVASGERDHGERQSTSIRPEQQIDALLGQETGDVLPSAHHAAPVIEGDEPEWSVRPTSTDGQAAGVRDMIHPEAYSVVRVLALAVEGSAQRDRDTGHDRFG